MPVIGTKQKRRFLPPKLTKEKVLAVRNNADVLLRKMEREEKDQQKKLALQYSNSVSLLDRIVGKIENDSTQEKLLVSIKDLQNKLESVFSRSQESVQSDYRTLSGSLSDLKTVFSNKREFTDANIVKSLNLISQQLSQLKTKKPEKKDRTDELISAISTLGDKIVNLQVEMPTTVDIGNFPPQMVPPAVTKVAIRGTGGTTEATVTALDNSNALATQIVDASGDAITSFGGGTQYADGAAAATPTGTQINWNDVGTQRAVSAAKPLPVTAYLSAVDNAVLDAIAADTGTIAGDTTSIDDKTPALGQALAASSVPVVLTAAQITTLTPQTDALTDTQLRATAIPVSLATVPSHAVTNAGTFATQAAATIADGADVTLGAKADAKSTATDTTAISVMSVLKQISASVQAPPSQAVTNAGTFAVQAAATLAAETTKVIGTVNVAAAQTIAVTNAGTFATQATLQTGSAAIGKLAANSGVDIGDVTLTAGTAEIGSLLPPDTDVTAHTNYARKYYTSAGAATDGIIWSPAAGKRWHVAWIYIQVSAASTVTLEDDKAAGDDPVWKSELAANSGAFMTFPDQYPMASQEDAADLLVTSSAGNIYISCGGWEI